MSPHILHSLRAKYGTSDLRNALHGSESMPAAQREIKYMFPDCKSFTQHVSSFKMATGQTLNQPICVTTPTNLSVLPSLPSALSPSSCVWADSHGRSSKRILVQIREPHSDHWTHWALQTEAARTLCKLLCSDYLVHLLPPYTNDVCVFNKFESRVVGWCIPPTHVFGPLFLSPYPG